MQDVDILQEVVQRLRTELEDDLIGILAGGSRLRGQGDPNSDIDVVVVVSRPARKRWNILIDGVEVEMFFNPEFQMERYFEEERADGRAVMPHLCASGEIIFDPHSKMMELQTKARAICDAGPPALSEFERWSFRYHAADVLRDIDDIADKDGSAVVMLVTTLAAQLIDRHYRISGRWMHKRKSAISDLARWDKEAAELVRSACAPSAAVTDRREAVNALAQKVLAPIGGLMPVEWTNEWQPLSPDTKPEDA